MKSKKVPESRPARLIEAYSGLIAKYTVTLNATAAGNATSMAVKPPQKSPE